MLCNSIECTNDLIFDFLIIFIFVLFINFFVNLKLRKLIYFIFFFISLKFLLVSNTLPFIWPGNSSIILSEKILNKELFKSDLSILASYDSPKYLFSYLFSYLSNFLKYDILYLYYYFSYLVVSLTTIFLSVSLKKITSNENKIFYIKHDLVRNFVIIIISLGICSRFSKFLGVGWPSFTNFNILYTLTEQSFSLMLGFAGLLLIVNKKKIISLPFYFFSTLIHPVIGFSNFLINIILNLNINFNFLSLIKKEVLFFLIKVLIPFVAIALIWNHDIVTVDEFIKIYIKYRHPHHYLTTYYVNYIFFVINIFLILLFLIYYKKNKQLTLISIIVFLYFFFSTAFQFIFIEIIPTKIFGKLGISRINIFSQMLIILTLCLAFQNFINNLFNKIIHSYFFKKINKLFEKIIFEKIYIIFMFLCLVFLLFNIFTKDIYLNIKEEFALSNELKKLKNDKKNILQFSESINNNLNLTSTIRLLSNYNVYSDNFFAFNEKYIIEWYDRRILTSSYSENNNLLCHLYENNVNFYISDKKLDVNTIYTNKKYYIYEISNQFCKK